MNSGMKLTGNQAPPIADISMITKVESPRADSGVGEMAAISIPNEVQAAAAKMQTTARSGR